MSAFPCVGRSYLSAGRAEVDQPLELTIECDGGPTGDCGWHVVIERRPWERPDGAWDIDITSDVFLPLHQQHLEHRARAAA